MAHAWGYPDELPPSTIIVMTARYVSLSANAVNGSSFRPGATPLCLKYRYFFSEKYLLRYAMVKTRLAVRIKLPDEIPNTEVLDLLR